MMTCWGHLSIAPYQALEELFAHGIVELCVDAIEWLARAHVPRQLHVCMCVDWKVCIMDCNDTTDTTDVDSSTLQHH